VTPDNVAVAMPQYDPAGAPKFIPAVDTHGATGDHGTPVDTHGKPAEHGEKTDTHGKPADSYGATDTHKAPVEEAHGAPDVPQKTPAGH
jgi:hypothetical protein